MAGLMSICQACTFIVYAEDFCKDNNCSFSRGSGTALAAMACYVIAGLGFFFSKDYPGVKVLEKEDDKKSRSESMEDRYEYDEEKTNDDEIDPRDNRDPYAENAY